MTGGKNTEKLITEYGEQSTATFPAMRAACSSGSRLLINASIYVIRGNIDAHFYHHARYILFMSFI